MIPSPPSPGDPRLAHIMEALRPLAVPTRLLRLDPRNARRHDERNLGAIETSLRRFGQRAPLVVQRQGLLVRAGNGRLTVATERLGWEYVAAVVVDEADAEAAAFALADNRSAELAEWDWNALSATLAELRADVPEFDVAGLGWNDAELAGLQLTAAWDAVQPDRDALSGSRTRVDRSTLVLRFTADQSDKLRKLVSGAGLGDEVTPELVLQLLVPAC